MLRHIKTRVTSLLRRGRLEEDLDRELAFHIDMLTEQHIKAGMPPAEAREQAMRRFGQVAGVKDAVRDTWLSRVFETLTQDVRYGLRNIRRNPGFALVVVVTMALGIGANTGIFSVVNGVLLQPLPYVRGDRLVVLRQQRPLAGEDDMRFSVKELDDYRARAVSLDGVAEFHSMYFILLGRQEPERVSTGVVSANFFQLLGVKPLYGRPFADGDEKPGAPAVLVLSHKYWERSFGGDPSVVGRVFQMNDRPHQVVGVLPPVPAYPEEVDVYMPTSACPFRSSKHALADRDMRMMQAFARVREDVALSKARADLAIVADGFTKDYPKSYPADRGFQVVAIEMQRDLTHDFQTTLYVLLGTAAFVLLIVCASIANLTLARMVRRQREMSVRAALGASRGRLLRQLLTESTLLAIIGGALGLVLASWSLDLLVLFAERFTTRATEIHIDRAVLLYTLVISAATGLVFGSVPAFAGSLGATPGLKDGARTTQVSYGLRSGLIVLQVAVSFMLLIGAGLTVRTLINLQRVDPGFTTANILTARVDLNFSKYVTPDSRRAFWERLEERFRNMPGVVSVGGAATFPLNEQGPYPSPMLLDNERPGSAPRPRVDIQIVSTDYFATLRQPLLDGRFFTRADRGRETLVAIVNRTMAQHYWPGQSAIGRRISGDDGEHWTTVVGVVADTRQQLNRAPREEVYVPMFQQAQLSSNWLFRSTLDANGLTREVREAVYSVDRDQPVDHFRTLEEVRLSTLESPRVTATLIGLFALLALVITAAGIAGVIAFSVNQRTQEFGVRMALGAPRTSVLALVLRQGLVLVAIGLGIGLAGALVLTRVLTTLLFGVEPTDAVTFLVVTMVLVAVAAIACLVPARRAATVDPMVALRVS